MLPTIYLKNLPGNLDRTMLSQLCGQFGAVVFARPDINAITGRSLGTGQVRFETQDAVTRALALGKIDYHGDAIVISASG